ncbi:MAG: GCN5-related N-acetyltransferase, partial [Bryobacterales bacterium]|nr:GCN5-related N-acetyltransferase [Bryobacterales bacterium]
RANATGGPAAHACERRAILNRVDFHTVEENLRESFRLLASSRPTGELREVSGVTIAAAGVAFQMFNAAFLSEPVEGERELDKRIMTAKVHFGARGLNWSYWVCKDWLDNKARRKITDTFKRNGLYLATVLPGMLAEKLAAPEQPLPRLKVRAVSDKATWSAFCHIGAICFNVPLQWFQEVFESPQVWQDGFGCYVGYSDGVPVSTAATVMASGAVGVYNVATIPSHQRRGFGEAVMRYALDRARERYGIERTILQSTAQGFRLYRRMGYSVVTDVAVYTS